ncbi:MAG: hydrogenase nickel incorporation protein HypB [Polyangiaceae bacterium]|nr:hydrogenase nickel incorporation protein HypB [Polyangiaceae bacterium]
MSSPGAGKTSLLEATIAAIGDRRRIAVIEGDLETENDARRIRAHGVVAINLMSSPGSGKTSLLESTIRALAGEFGIAVVEGDLATENDAARIRACGVPAVQITTGNACHLDAQMVHDALHDLPLAGLDLLFVENVGNLVCPASFDLGVHRNVTLLSVPEGDDKPAKYPVMFRGADLALITKVDLLPHIEEFSVERAQASLRQVGFAGPILELGKRGGAGFDAWLAWLRNEVATHRTAAA